MNMSKVRPYEGNGKYIFISYAHKDSSLIYPIIQRMSAEGYQIWYDEGIDPGTEWDEEIAAHVEGCDSFIAFISSNYLNSDNCKDELNFARDLSKERLLVYLEEVKLPSGMAMRLNRLQAIHKYTYANEIDFYTKLFVAPMLSASKQPSESQAAQKSVTTSPVKHSATTQSHKVPQVSANVPSSIPEELGERYIIGNKIAEGGVATVYEGINVRLQLPVVVKVYNTSFADKCSFFTNELLKDKLLRIAHPHMGSIYEIGSAKQPYIVQQRIAGYTIKQALASKRATFDYHLSLEIIIEILSALEHLHEKDIFYGDVTIDNIMLAFTPDKVPRLRIPYLVDFSECNFNGCEIPVETVMCASDMSPERKPGGTLDFRSDIYEVGIILEKLILKCMETSRTMYSYNKPEIDIYSTSVFGIIKKATSISPADRYQSATEMRLALQEVLESIKEYY